MLVSVIIPTFNSKKFIRECIDSVLNQTYKNIEIIVVDDGSNDNTEDYVRNYFKLNNFFYFKKNNGGPASARNFGIKTTKGDFICFLDADDVWLPDKIKVQLDFLIKENMDFCYTRRSDFLSEDGVNNSRVNFFKAYSGSVLRKLFWNNFITNSSVMMSRKVVEKCGFLKEDKYLFAIEDYEYWLRVASKFKIYFIDKPLVYYRIHSSQISNPIKNSDLKISKMFFNLFLSNELRKDRIIILFVPLKFILSFFKKYFFKFCV